jgi:hypothetical protein
MWGKFLDVEGGLDTVMEALTVFNFRTLWSMVERDIGRRAALNMPPVSLLLVGGSPPVNFVRAGLKYFADHYPGGLTKVALFEKNQFKGALSQTVFKFLPSADTEYHFTSNRMRLFEILDVEDSYIPDSILDCDDLTSEQLTARLASTAAMLIDREWGREIRKLGHDVCSQREQQKCSVKNTFVEVGEDEVESPRKESGRVRAVSDSENYEVTKQSPIKEPYDTHTAAVQKSPMYVQIADSQGVGATSKLPSQGPDIVYKSTKPQNSGKRQVSGYTRRRRKLAIEKLKQEASACDYHINVRAAVTPSQPDCSASARSRKEQDCRLLEIATAETQQQKPETRRSSEIVTKVPPRLSTTPEELEPLQVTSSTASFTSIIDRFYFIAERAKVSSASAAVLLRSYLRRTPRPLLLLVILAITSLVRLLRQMQRRRIPLSVSQQSIRFA